MRALTSTLSSQFLRRINHESKVSYIPKDYNSITPYLIVKDAARAIEYYKKVFGATETVRMNGPDGKVGHAELKIGNSHIMLADENPSMGAGTHQRRHDRRESGEPLHIPSGRRYRSLQRAVAEGAKILKPVEDQFYGDRSGFIQDPFGHLWGDCHPHGRCGAQRTWKNG